MARTPYSGTPPPHRSRTPVLPPPRGRLVFASAMAALVVAVGAFGLYLAGARQTFSPGAVTSAHARSDLRCAQCHTPGVGAVAVRCERCHDPVGSDRLQLSAHVLSASGDLRAADAASATPLECATCHTDHRGRQFDPRRVDDRECASCHTFRSLAAHPEFAPIRTPPPSSVRFDHDRHIVEAEKRASAPCQSCHEQSNDARSFQPVVFDRHCASCHLEKGRLRGETDAMELKWLAMPDGSPVAPRRSTQPAFTPGNRGRESAAGFVHRDPFVVYNAARLRRAIDRDGVDAELSNLQTQIAYLEQLQTVAPPGLVPAAERDQAIEGLRAEVAMYDRMLAAPATVEDDDRALAEISGAAQSTLTALGGGTPSVPPGGLADFESRRRELLQLLDVIDGRIGAPARERIVRLRRQVLALQRGAAGAGEIARARRHRQRLVDRLVVEREIESSPIDRLDQPSQYVGLDREELARQLTQLQSESDRLERAPRATVAVDETERAAQSRTLASLLTPCRKCHEMDATATRLAPVRIAQPLLQGSVFNHKPHTLQASCESCHGGVRASKAAADVNVPSIDKCRTCHNSSQVRDDCATCHLFHPRSVVHLATVPR